MLELAALLGGVALAALGLVVGLNARAEWAERDRLRQFQEAMRRAGHPHPDQRED
jgi:hypothetical protein